MRTHSANPSKEWREKVHALSRDLQFPNAVKRKEAPEQWFFFKVVSSELKLEEAEPSNAVKLADEISKWVKGEISSGRLAKIAKIVAEHLKTLPSPAEIASQ